jgi:hypothetical protein
LNKYCRELSVKYETLKRLRYLARPGDWALGMDVQDGFHAVSVAPEHRCYFTFRLNGVLLRCAVLPFGWSGSPAVFCRVRTVLTRLLRSPQLPARRDDMSPAHWLEARDRLLGKPAVKYSGARTLPYMDDYLLLYSTRQEALEGAEMTRRVLEFLGLEPNDAKCTWDPTQRLIFLGLEI